MENMEAMKILKKQYKDISTNPLAGLGIFPSLFNEDDYFNWKVIMQGPKDSPYREGIFMIKVIFPENYPNSAPDIIFLTPIYHPNVNPNKTEKDENGRLGYINLGIIKKWKPETKLTQIFIQLFSLFFFPNTELSYTMDIAIEYKFKRALYEEKVKYFTKKYSKPYKLNKIYDKSWDFSFDDSGFIPDENPKVKEVNKKIYKYDRSDNEKIILNFENNGINKISLECQMNALTRDVIYRCIDNLRISKNIDSDEILFIHKGTRINLDVSIRNNGLRNYDAITIIYDFDA